jgi:AraC-like DNA-binding protein
VGPSFGFARLLEVISSVHVVSESGGTAVLRHEDAYCFLFVVHGPLELDRRGTRRTLHADHVFVLPPTRLGRVAAKYGEGAELYYIRFRLRRRTARPVRGLDVPDHVVLGNPGRMTHLVRLLMDERRRRFRSPLVLHHLMALMLCELWRSWRARRVTEPRDDRLETMASRVDAYIAAHYHEPIGTPDIAAELRYNPDYLERAYRSERGLSMREAIHARRIREARAQLLLQRTLCVAEVAALCGYSDAGYFRRVFKRETSLTPRGYRQVHVRDRAHDGGSPPGISLTSAVSDTLEALNGGLFVSPGFGTHVERVIDSYELIFVTQGHLDLFEGERTFHLVRNQALLLEPNVRHGGTLPFAPDLNFYWAHFRPRRCPSPDLVLRMPKVWAVRDPEALTELFCRFISDQESGTLDATSATQLIALMLCTNGRTEPRAGGGRRAAVATRTGLAEAVRRYIETEYRGPISTSTIARSLRYNPDYLERVFRDQESMSIIDAIHQKRIGVARACLHNDVGKNISEIAFQCGYTDAGYFHRMFKRLTGLTPRVFRSLYARTHINTH